MMPVSCRLASYSEIPVIKISRDVLLLVVSAAKRKYHLFIRRLTRIKGNE